MKTEIRTLAQAAPFTLAALPYEPSVLAPVISTDTVRFHYGKHHRAYVEKLNELVSGTEWQELKLEEIIIGSASNPDKADILNNAAQVWNHDFYWKSLSPAGGGKPEGALLRKIESDFGSFKNFLKVFMEAGMTQFGSGWIWLVEDHGRLEITKTSNAENPLSQGHGKALLVLDVWEHAYYLDFQNRRIDYLKATFELLVNWRFAENNLSS